MFSSRVVHALGFVEREVGLHPATVLGGHEMRRFEDLACLCELLGVAHHLGDAEVENLHEIAVLAAFDLLDIVRLEVSMNDARAMRRGERFGDLSSDMNRSRCVHAPAGIDRSRERLAAAEKLHRHERLFCPRPRDVAPGWLSLLQRQRERGRRDTAGVWPRL